MSDTWQLPPITIERRYSFGQSNTLNGYHLEDYDIASIHTKYKGRGVKVGICDSGVSALHSTSGILSENVKGTRDFTGSGDFEDKLGHGTHVAGIVKAVAPDVSLYIAKCIGNEGGGTTAALENALDYCMDEKVHIINLSLGTRMHQVGIAQRIVEARNKGIVVICASGNNSGAVDFPSRMPYTLAISAINQTKELAPFSSRGKEVSVCGPGVSIMSTYRDGGYAKLSGTSMACPWVVGNLALILNRFSFNIEKALEELNKNIEDLGRPGRDDLYGRGVPVISKRLLDDPIDNGGEYIIDISEWNKLVLRK